MLKIRSNSRKMTGLLWSRSNILKATLKLDSGMLSNVTKDIHVRGNINNLNKWINFLILKETTQAIQNDMQC